MSSFRLIDPFFCPEDDEDMVRFEFEGDTRKLRGHKQVLVDASPVFERMFDKNWIETNGSVVKMADNVFFNQFEIFMLFLKCTHGILVVDELTLQETCDLYYYAHKYNVVVMEIDIRDQVTARLEAATIKNDDDYCAQPLTLPEFVNCIQLVTLHSLDGLRTKLDDVELDVSDDNVFEFYETIKKHNYDSLKPQIISFLMSMQPNASWSLEMMKDVIGSFQNQVLIEVTLNYGSKSENVRVDPLNRISILFRFITKLTGLVKDQFEIKPLVGRFKTPSPVQPVLDISLNKTIYDLGIRDGHILQIKERNGSIVEISKVAEQVKGSPRYLPEDKWAARRSSENSRRLSSGKWFCVFCNIVSC